MAVPPLKVNLNPMVITFLLHTLTQPLVVWYSYVGFQVSVLLSGTLIVLFLLGWFAHLHLHPF